MLQSCLEILNLSTDPRAKLTCAEIQCVVTVYLLDADGLFHAPRQVNLNDLAVHVNVLRIEVMRQSVSDCFE